MLIALERMKFACIVFLLTGIHIAAGAENRGRSFFSKKTTRHLRQCSSWEQIGKDLVGMGKGDEAGWSVSLSKDGTVVAFGADGNDSNGENSGHVLVFAWDSVNNEWLMRGKEIPGSAEGDLSGVSVSMSDSGAVLAIGAPKNSKSAGNVRIFEWNTGEWKQKGADIIGLSENDQSGNSVSMSKDGKVVAIGAKGHDGNGQNSGHVRVYKWSTGGSWDQRGKDIHGEAESDASGVVSISGNGKVVAIGAVSNDGNGKNSGHARVYNWNSNKQTWIKRGDDFDGKSALDGLGWSLDLSNDGSVLAIGALYNDRDDNSETNSGHVQFHKWKDDKWSERGEIKGDRNDHLGLSVSMSDDGATVAIGASDKCDGGRSYVLIYEWVAELNTWKQLTSVSAKGGDQFGASVSMSGDGKMIAIGAPYYDKNNMNDTGYVRVMKLEEQSCPCVDSPLRIKSKFSGKKTVKSCEWVNTKSTRVRCGLLGVAESCPLTCGACAVCADTPNSIQFFIDKGDGSNKILKTCEWVGKGDANKRCSYAGVSDSCRQTCGNC